LGPFSFQIKKKNQFQSQTLFSLFFCPWCKRCERKLLESRAKERKFMLARISAPKTVEIGVKCYFSNGLGGFFALKLTRKTDLILIRFFCFGLISGFGMVFYFFEAMIGLSSYL